jgi:predicted O-methyltransferase YrrM
MLHGDSLAAADWWARPRDGQGGVWITNYQKSLGVRHREAITAIVAELQVTSVLEIGCHCGPNLVKLAEANPQLQAAGIDVNADAIAAGQAWVAQRGLDTRVELAVRRFPEGTSTVATGIVDVVLSCYSLAYVAFDDLDAALYEMGRLARRAVIIAEPMVLGDQMGSGRQELSGYREWTHNYERALRWIGSLADMTTRVVMVDPPVDRLNAILVATRGEMPVSRQR